MMPRANTLPCVVPAVDSTQKPGTAEIKSAELAGACWAMSSALNVEMAHARFEFGAFRDRGAGDDYFFDTEQRLLALLQSGCALSA